MSLINDVLDLSKIEAGKMEMHLETFDPRAAIGPVAATNAPLVEEGSNRTALDTAADLGAHPPTSTRVRRVLLNLLSNANKFTERGVITLCARRAPGTGEPSCSTPRPSA